MRSIRRALGGEVVEVFGGLAVVFVVVFLTALALDSSILSGDSLSNVAVYGVPITLLALGELFIIVGGGGGIDLSVGAVASLSGILFGVAAHAGIDVWVAAALAVVAATAMGALNGFSVCVLRIPAIIATLGTLFAFQGLALVVSGGNEIYDFPPGFFEIGQGSLLGLPFQLIAILVPVSLLLWYLGSRSSYGLRLKLCGINAKAAFLSGIEVSRVRFVAYVMAGALSGIAGLIDVAQNTSARPDAFSGGTLTAITIALLGGASVFGGSGTVPGTLFASAILALLTYSFVLANVNTALATGVVGALLIGVFLLQNAIAALRATRTRTAREPTAGEAG